MIGRLTGRLVEKSPPTVVVEAGGIGYEVDVPMSTFYLLPATGQEVKLFTHLTIREDAHLLFGFATEAERRVFRQLLKITGIGARTALSLLSGMSVDELYSAVSQQDGVRLTRVPGIGKKTAERLLLELKDKLALTSGTPAAGSRAASDSDALNALLALGYSDKEAGLALKALPKEVGVSEGIKLALKALAK